MSTEPTPPPRASSAHVALTREILRDVFGPVDARHFAIRLWDGTVEAPPSGDAGFALVLRHPGALRRMLLPPTQRTVGEAYVRGDFDVEGDLEAATGLSEPLVRRATRPAALPSLWRRLRRLPRDTGPAASGDAGHTGRWRFGGKHSRGRDRAAVRFHYDIGNDFYRLFLDRRMAYSCAYFATGSEDLDAAQEAKLDLICRKLRLKPGQRLLDIGCGWGSLILHAAEHYGVDATGVTLSGAQASLARERIAAAGLTDRCRVEVRDYRDLPGDARYDRVASVGMVEHVGRHRLPEYFDHVRRLLQPGGLFLNHGIVSLAPLTPRRRFTRPLRRWGSFIERHVFPDSELLPVAENLGPAETVGLEVRDVESLREHYAATLRRWGERLEARHEEAIGLVGEATYRVWRLYMAGSARNFAAGRLGVIQALLARPDAGGRVALPRTRADLYANGGRRAGNGAAVAAGAGGGQGPRPATGRPDDYV